MPWTPATRPDAGHPSRPRRGAAGWWLFLLVLGTWGAALHAVPARADARTDYLIRLLETSTTFRVRVQAALSLGRVDASPEVIDALGEALRDEHPSVRTAAASSLSALEDPASLDELRQAQDDRDRTVRRTVKRAIRRLESVARQERLRQERSRPDTTYYVGVGVPGTRVSGIDEATREALQAWMREQVAGIPGVALAPVDESPAQAERVIAARRLEGFYVDSSITAIRTTDVGTRAEVSVVVNTYPGRNVRAMLSGAATVQGASEGPATRLQAVRGALRGALRRLPQAMGQSRSNGG